MRIGFTNPQKIETLGNRLFTKRLMTIKVIAQKSDTPRRIMRAPGIQPAFSRSQFTILLFLALLWLDKLRWPGHHMGLAGRDDHGRDSTVAVQSFAVFEGLATTTRTRDFFPGKEIRAISRHQQSVAH